MPGRRIKVGDYFRIPLPDGRSAYCQYLQWNKQMGYLIGIFNKITEHPIPLDEIRGAGWLFPPVFVGLKASVTRGRWEFIGNHSVERFEFPLFRNTSATKPGVYHNWWLWDGEQERFIGSLPPELASLEVQAVWGDELLEERIASGRNLFAEIL